MNSLPEENFFLVNHDGLARKLATDSSQQFSGRRIISQSSRISMSRCVVYNLVPCNRRFSDDGITCRSASIGGTNDFGAMFGKNDSDKALGRFAEFLFAPTQAVSYVLLTSNMGPLRRLFRGLSTSARDKGRASSWTASTWAGPVKT